MIDIDKFLFIYQGEHGTLNDHQRQGLTDLLHFINGDTVITDIRWIAYMLATVRHETAGTFLPIAEYGKGKGRKYGEPDRITGQTYYGRGYVQLTWKDNYLTMGNLLRVDMVSNPDLAMQPELAYGVMSWGMRKGMFTGVSLAKYFNEDKTDYINARKIINGTDRAVLIAGYAMDFEKILKETTA